MKQWLAWVLITVPSAQYLSAAERYISKPLVVAAPPTKADDLVAAAAAAARADSVGETTAFLSRIDKALKRGELKPGPDLVEARSIAAESLQTLSESKKAEAQFAKADKERAGLGGNSPLFVSAMLRRVENLDRTAKPDEAEKLLRQAIVMQLEIEGRSTARAQDLELRLVPLLDELDRSAEAETVLSRIRMEREARLGASHPLSVAAERVLAEHYEFISKLDQAEAVRFRIYEAVRTTIGASLVQRVAAPLSLAGILKLRGHIGDGDQYLLRALAEIRGATYKEPALEGYVLTRLVDSYLKQEMPSNALEDILPSLVAYWEGRSGKNSARALEARESLGEALLGTDPVRAEALFREQLELRRTITDTRPYVIAFVDRKISEALAKQGKLVDALSPMRENIALLELEFGKFSTDALVAHDGLANLLAKAGRPDAAEAEYRYVLRKIPRNSEWDTLTPAFMRLRLMQLYLDQKKRARALGEAKFALAAARVRRAGVSAAQLAVRHQIADILEGAGEWTTAEIYRRQVVTGRNAASASDPRDRVDALISLADNLENQNRTTEATLQYQAAVETARQLDGEDGYLTLKAYQRLADFYDQSDRPDEGIVILRKLYDRSLAKFGPSGNQTLTWGVTLSSHLQFAGRLEEAEELQRGFLKPEAGLRTAYRPMVVLMIASILNARGKPKEAADYLNQHVALFDRNTDKGLRLGFDMMLVESYRSLERFDEASRLMSDLFDTRCAAIVSAGDREYCDQLVPNYVYLLSKTGHSASAAAQLPRAFALAEAEWKKVTSRDFTRRMRVDDRTANGGFSDYQDYLDVLWRAQQQDVKLTPSDEDNAFVAIQRIATSDGSRAMAAAAARLASGNGEIAHLLQRQHALAKDIVTIEERAADKLLNPQASQPGGKVQLSDVEALRVEHQAVTDKIATDFPRYAALAAPRALTLAEAKAQLGPREGLLVIASGGDGFHSLAIGPTKFARARSASGLVDVGNAAFRLFCQMDKIECSKSMRGEALGGPKTPFEADGYRRFGASDANFLYRELIAPVESALDGVSTLYVVTDARIADLPLGMLLTEPLPKGADPADPVALHDAKWLADRYAIISLPAVGSLEHPRQFLPAKGTGLEGYGDPTLVGNGMNRADDRGVTAIAMTRGDEGYQVSDPLLLRTMQPLLGTRLELNALAKVFTPGLAKLHFRDDATETAIKSNKQLSQAAVVVFATHGLLPRSVFGLVEPGLLFSPPEEPTGLDDGVLTASEAAQLSLTADIVILSACNTASNARGATDDSLSGLARGFLYAGAKSLLASHWRVSDKATAALTVEMISARQRESGVSRARALQRAMAAVRSGKRADGSAVENWAPEWSHPSYWAAFSLVANSNE